MYLLHNILCNLPAKIYLGFRISLLTIASSIPFFWIKLPSWTTFISDPLFRCHSRVTVWLYGFLGRQLCSLSALKVWFHFSWLFWYCCWEVLVSLVISSLLCWFRNTSLSLISVFSPWSFYLFVQDSFCFLSPRIHAFHKFWKFLSIFLFLYGLSLLVCFFFIWEC